MDRNDFIVKFAEQFEETEPGKILMRLVLEILKNGAL